MKLLFRKDKEFCLLLYGLLGFVPGRTYLYRKALTHSSLVTGPKRKLACNERLEFLGDAILDAIISDVVFQHFKGKREGFLTNTRSKIVQRETLNKVAVEIKLDKLIISSTHSHSHNSYIYGNAFEALIGAIYLDLGINKVYSYIKSFMYNDIKNVNFDVLTDFDDELFRRYPSLVRKCLLAVRCGL